MPPASPNSFVHALLPAEQESVLRKQLVMDVSERLKYGFFAYSLFWVICALPGDFILRERYYVAVHFVGLTLIAFARLSLHGRLPRLLEYSVGLSQSAFRALVLLHGLYWGVLGGLAMSSPAQESMRDLIAPVTLGIMLACVAMIALDRFLAITYPAIVVAPTLIFAYALDNPLRHIYLVSIAMLLLYARMISKNAYRDYWTAQRSRVLLEEKAAQLEALSTTDALTQVRNRRYIDLRLPELWSEARRQRQPLSVALVDLDHFKKINDSFGHAFGDECLKHVAAALTDALQRPTDCLARYGGEEFLVILPNTPSVGAQQVAQRMLKSVSASEVVYGGHAATLTCSIGLCTVVPSVDGATPTTLLHDADLALYAAKAGGRNRFNTQRPANDDAMPSVDTAPYQAQEGVPLRRPDSVNEVPRIAA